MSFSRYLSMFLTLFLLHLVIIFYGIAFIRWTLNPAYWGEEYRGGLALFVLLNFGLSALIAWEFAKCKSKNLEVKKDV